MPNKPYKYQDNPFTQLAIAHGLTHADVMRLTGLSRNVVARLLTTNEGVTDYTRQRFAEAFGKRVIVEYKVVD